MISSNSKNVYYFFIPDKNLVNIKSELLFVTLFLSPSINLLIIRVYLLRERKIY